jgi:anaerobic ribonucleoside-triphosphate reductase activating protein
MRPGIGWGIIQGVELRVAQVVPDTEAEGPGRRFALWVQGCTLHCPSCCNPEMFSAQGGAVMEAEALAARIVATPGLEGLSVLGGEPFQQAEAVAEVCARVRRAGRSVMVYSGYTLEELRALPGPGAAALLAQTDLLADGRFVREAPEARRRWLGSRNQRLHFLTARYRPDDPRFLQPNTVELRLEGGQLTINGWPAAADALRRR